MKLYVDGATTETCYVLGNRKPVVTPTLNKVTNNVGEYHALIRGLTDAIRRGIKDIEVFSDSQLMINQLRVASNGLPIYACKNERLASLRRIVLDLTKAFSSITFNWVRREENLAGIHLEGRKRCRTT